MLLRLTRSATCVKWSPNEDKFAVGSGEKSICVCQFMEEFGAGGGWTSKSIRKCPLSGNSIKSTVLCVAWHPNNCFLIAGSADMKCRIFNAYLKSVDGRKVASTAFGLDPADKKLKFGTCIAEFAQAKGWVHDACFSPSGSIVAVAGHDSSIHFATIPQEKVAELDALPIMYGDEHEVQSITMKGLPFKAVAFIDDTHMIAGGHDAMPHYFVFEGSAWVWKGSVDKPSQSKVAKKATGGVSAARAMWANKTDLGAGEGGATGGAAELQSLHQNSISGIRVMSAEAFSTCGYDGRVVVWDMPCLGTAVQ
eukprot:COSAG05_NODE_80_length_21046_cov_45.708325_8_plen_308_part_00